MPFDYKTEVRRQLLPKEMGSTSNIGLATLLPPLPVLNRPPVTLLRVNSSPVNPGTGIYSKRLSTDFQDVSPVVDPSPSPQSPVSSDSSIYLSARSTIQETSLELNFNYKRRYNVDPIKLNMMDDETFISSSSSSLTSSSGDGTDLATSWRPRTQRKTAMQDFCKFLPAPLSSLTIPRLLLNDCDPKELQEAQAALLLAMPTASRSDTLSRFSTTSSTTTSKKRWKKRSKLKKLFQCVKPKTDSPIKGNAPAIEFKTERRLNPPAHIPKISDIRFDYSTNKLFCDVNSEGNPQFSAVLYVEMAQKPNINLCHVQTELCVAAMLNFFHPWQNIQFSWKPRFQAFLTNLLATSKVTPKFTHLVYLKRFEAVLVVSPTASNLLRHNNLCFLYSLANVLRINITKLLLLVESETSSLQKRE